MIPANLRKQVLLILHEHFGMQRMKQLARTAVYWPDIDADIMDLCRKCITCAEHQNKPTKAAVHPWMLPEKSWSRIHVDHAINFMGYNWLVVIDSYMKYPCIHVTQSISTKSTIDLLGQGLQQTIGQKNFKSTARSKESFISRVLLTIPQQMGLQNA